MGTDTFLAVDDDKLFLPLLNHPIIIPLCYLKTFILSVVWQEPVALQEGINVRAFVEPLDD